MWDLTIEKLENHKYRLLVKWDGTEEMLNELLEDGFSVFDDNNIYYSDYEDDCTLFDFGMSMCECYQKLSSNRLFNIDYILHFSRQPVDADLLKDVEERIPTYNIIKAMIDNWGMEPYLFLFAKNYDSLIDEATQRYHDSDEASFMSWLKESVEPRFTTQVSSDVYSQYLILNKTKFNLSDLFCGYWYAWQIVQDNWEEFKNWISRVEYADEIDFQFYDSIFNHKDTIQKQFNIVYFYGYGKLARILFEMLNKPDVNYKVKKLIKDVLMEYAQSDSEFAEILQKMYSEYKSISGGIDIDFEIAGSDETVKEMQLTPQTREIFAENNVKSNSEEKASTNEAETQDTPQKKKRWRLQKYLSRPVEYRKDSLPHCQGIKVSIIKKGDCALQKFIQGIAEWGYIDDDPITKNSFAYALTGRGFRTKIITVKWHHKKAKKGIPESVKVLLYISKYMFDNTAGETYTQLFEVLNAGPNPCIKDGKDQSSIYSESVSEEFKQFYKSCFD